MMKHFPLPKKPTPKANVGEEECMQGVVKCTGAVLLWKVERQEL